MMRVLRIVYVVVLGVAIVWLVATRWAEVAELIEGARLLFIILSLLASFGMILIGAWFWTTCLTMLGHPPRLAEVSLATSRSLLARYVPGSVWFAVGRVALLRRAGLPTGPLTATAVLELALSLATVLAFGAALLGAAGELPGGVVWLGAVLVALVAASSPPIGGRFASWLAAKRGATLSLTWNGYIRLIGVSVVFWAWSALTFSLYLRAFPVADPHGDIFVVAGGFMLAWGVGFLTLIAPQGVGVFEVGLATLFAVDRVIEFAFVFGGYRLVMLARDLIATGAAELIATRRASPVSARKD